jgi:hypothetical protein
MWRCPSFPNRILFVCETKETGEQCLSGGFVEMKDGAADETVNAVSLAGNLKSRLIFEAMSEKLRNMPDMADKVSAAVVWEITSGGEKAGEWGK